MPNESAPIASERVPALEGVRGVAIIWVVLHNTADLLPSQLHGLWRAFAFLVQPGWIGVQLFFALSGFLITGGLLETQNASNYFRAFYARRALRILPLYYTVLILLLIVAPALHLDPTQLHADLKQQLSLWLFTVNWTQAPYGFGHFWSLAVEEQFYLFWPFIVHRLSARRFVEVCAAIAVIALVMRDIMVFSGASSQTVYTATTSRLDALALGGAGACLLRIPAAKAWLDSRLSSVSLSALVLFVLGFAITHGYNPDTILCKTLGFSLLALCCAALVTTAAAGGELAGHTLLARALSWSPLRYWGKYSYAIYVFHQLIHKLLGEPWMLSRFSGHPPAYAVYAYSLVIGLVSFCAAFLSYHGLEKRFLALKSRFPPYTGQQSVAELPTYR
jgi:peptidoglycan/LPS O-acetylase OafA/YrhL